MATWKCSILMLISIVMAGCSWFGAEDDGEGFLLNPKDD